MGMSLAGVFRRFLAFPIEIVTLTIRGLLHWRGPFNSRIPPCSMRFMTTVALIPLRQMGGVSHGTDTSSMRRVVRLPGIGRALQIRPGYLCSVFYKIIG